MLNKEELVSKSTEELEKMFREEVVTMINLLVEEVQAIKKHIGLE